MASPQDNRLAVLNDLAILDTPSESAYDDIARLASVCCQNATAAVNFVDDKRHWTKAIVGVEGGQGASVSADLSFCAATVGTDSGLLKVPDTQASERWSSHPLVTGSAALRFYAGATIVVSGEAVGVVCVFGDQPRDLGRDEELALIALARQAATNLELRKRNAELRELVVTDSLTGLPNRVLLSDRLESAITQGERSGELIGVLFCDVDDFKQVNDRYGHDAGDLLLCQIADGLRAATRDTDTVARFAGDEFAVVCPALGTARELDAIIDRIDRIVGMLHESDSGPPSPRLSVGAALVRYGDTAAGVLRRADEAMYEVKLGRRA